MNLIIPQHFVASLTFELIHSTISFSLSNKVRIAECVSLSDAIMNFSGGVLTVYGANETASIFATYPSEFLTLGRSFLDQVSGGVCVTFLLKASFHCGCVDL